MTSSSSTKHLLASIQLHLEAAGVTVWGNSMKTLFNLASSVLPWPSPKDGYLIQWSLLRSRVCLSCQSCLCSAEKWNSQFGRKRGIRERHGPGHPRPPERSAELPLLTGLRWGAWWPKTTWDKKKKRTSLVVLWIRICLPKQGTRVRPWSGKIPGTPGQPSPHHQYWESPALSSWSPTRGARAPQRRVTSTHRTRGTTGNN